MPLSCWEDSGIISGVSLSLNQNEAGLIAAALDVDQNLSDEEFVKLLFEACSVDTLVIHRTNDAMAFDGKNLKNVILFSVTIQKY